MLIGNRENSTIDHQSVSWYFPNGTKIVSDNDKYVITYGNEISDRNLDWTQLLIKDTTYDDEMVYRVEFTFSSGVKLTEYVKLDVVGRTIKTSTA